MSSVPTDVDNLVNQITDQGLASKVLERLSSRSRGTATNRPAQSGGHPHKKMERTRDSRKSSRTRRDEREKSSERAGYRSGRTRTEKVLLWNENKAPSIRIDPRDHTPASRTSYGKAQHRASGLLSTPISAGSGPSLPPPIRLDYSLLRPVNTTVDATTTPPATFPSKPADVAPSANTSSVSTVETVQRPPATNAAALPTCNNQISSVPLATTVLERQAKNLAVGRIANVAEALAMDEDDDTGNASSMTNRPKKTTIRTFVEKLPGEDLMTAMRRVVAPSKGQSLGNSSRGRQLARALAIPERLVTFHADDRCHNCRAGVPPSHMPENWERWPCMALLEVDGELKSRCFACVVRCEGSCNPKIRPLEDNARHSPQPPAIPRGSDGPRHTLPIGEINREAATPAPASADSGAVATAIPPAVSVDAPDVTTPTNMDAVSSQAQANLRQAKSEQAKVEQANAGQAKAEQAKAERWAIESQSGKAECDDLIQRLEMMKKWYDQRELDGISDTWSVIGTKAKAQQRYCSNLKRKF